MKKIFIFFIIGLFANCPIFCANGSQDHLALKDYHKVMRMRRVKGFVDRTQSVRGVTGFLESVNDEMKNNGMVYAFYKARVKDLSQKIMYKGREFALSGIETGQIFQEITMTPEYQELLKIEFEYPEYGEIIGQLLQEQGQEFSKKMKK